MGTPSEKAVHFAIYKCQEGALSSLRKGLAEPLKDDVWGFL